MRTANLGIGILGQLPECHHGFGSPAALGRKKVLRILKRALGAVEAARWSTAIARQAGLLHAPGQDRSGRSRGCRASSGSLVQPHIALLLPQPRKCSICCHELLELRGQRWMRSI